MELENAGGCIHGPENLKSLLIPAEHICEDGREHHDEEAVGKKDDVWCSLFKLLL